MTITVSPNQSNVQTALRSFLLATLPAGVQVVSGQDNRVPEPPVTEFVVMTTIRRDRLATTVDNYADAWFTASIAGSVMTVTAVHQGLLQIGSLLFGVDLLDSTTVMSQLTGSAGGTAGGTGTYQVSQSQNLSSRVVAAGVINMLQATEVTVQLDVHSSMMTTASDMAQRITTMFRDDWGYMFFKRTGYDVVPLHADQPKQIPFINAEEQYESRWVIEACLQANQAVLNVPQQFADTLLIGLIDVDSKYSP